MREIHIGLICENFLDVERFIYKNINCAQRGINGEILMKQDYFIFHHIKPYTDFPGLRLNMVYANKETLQSEWFYAVIRPMLIAGVCDINE